MPEQNGFLSLLHAASIMCLNAGSTNMAGFSFWSEFSLFYSMHGITHKLSSPYNPESNSLAEAAMKNMKSLVLRCKSQGENLCQAVASWRNMVCQGGSSPALMFFDLSSHDALHCSCTANQDLGTTLPDFKLGDRVWMQHHTTKKWYKTAVVIESGMAVRIFSRCLLPEEERGRSEAESPLDIVRTRSWEGIIKTKHASSTQVDIPMVDKAYMDIVEQGFCYVHRFLSYGEHRVLE